MGQKSQIKIGIILNYINMIVGSLIPLFYTPIMLRLLGQSEYGLYKLSGSVTSYLGLISLGMGAAISRYLIKARVEEGQLAEERVLGMFLVIFRCIAMVALVVGIVVMLNLDVWYSSSLQPAELIRMKKVVFILVCNTAISFLMSPYMSVVSSHERFLFLQTMNIISTCVAPILNLVVLFLGYASIGMAVSSLSANLLVRAIYYFYIRKCIELRPRYKDMPTYLLKEIMIFSFWIFVSNIVNQLYNATDTVMIGTVPALGTTGVSVYSIGATMSSMVLSLTIGVSTLLTPRTNKMVFSGASMTELTDLAIKVGRIQGYIVTLIVTGFIAFGKPFISIYAGEEYTDAYLVGVLLMFHSMIPLVQSVCLNIIVAQNKHKFRSLTYLGIALVNIIGTWFLMHTSLGIIGAALMTSIAGIIGTWFVMNWYYAKKIHIEIKRFWKSLGKLYIIPIALCIITLILAQWVDFYKIWIFCIGVIIYTLVYVGLSWKFIMNNYEKQIILEPLIQLLSILKKKRLDAK